MAPALAGYVKLFVPGSLHFLLLGLCGGALILVVRRSAWLSVLTGVVALGLGYGILSLPWTANCLASHLYSRFPRTSQTSEPAPSTIAVFAGDHAFARIQETARLYQVVRPRSVIVSGDEDFRNWLITAAVPADHLIWDSQSRNTREQALRLRQIVDAYRIDRVLLVASPIHMARALGACEAAGVRAVPSPTAFPHQNLATGGIRRVIPRRDALRLSAETIYEYLGLVYYGFQGWLPPH